MSLGVNPYLTCSSQIKVSIPMFRTQQGMGDSIGSTPLVYNFQSMVGLLRAFQMEPVPMF